jgi:hypothetical protein
MLDTEQTPSSDSISAEKSSEPLPMSDSNGALDTAKPIRLGKHLKSDLRADYDKTF